MRQAGTVLFADFIKQALKGEGPFYHLLALNHCVIIWKRSDGMGRKARQYSLAGL
jgi:hypothetical protein